MDEVVEFYICCCVVCYLEKKCVCIFVVGIGNLYFIMDIVVILCVNEMVCEVILMGKNGVDGVYDKDLVEYDDVVCYDVISYDEVLFKCLKVMDVLVIVLVWDNNLFLIVFGLDESGGFKGIMVG